MRLGLIAIVFSVLIFSCMAHDTTKAEVENDLKTTMQKYLYTSVNNDSSTVKYRVLDVTYYEESDEYLCEFKVHMKTNTVDTTGVMKANISKDLKKIVRLY